MDHLPHWNPPHPLLSTVPPPHRYRAVERSAAFETIAIAIGESDPILRYPVSSTNLWQLAISFIIFLSII